MEIFAKSDTPIAGLFSFQRQPKTDSRGEFERLYCDHELDQFGLNIRQINRSLTRLAGSIRGMHFQYPPHEELKVVSCLKGEVFDVAVDLRLGSPTFLKWYGIKLSQDNHTSLVIPGGFAHGFQTLTDDCEMLYLHSAAFHQPSEGHINPFDPKAGIIWPAPVAEISDRDKNAKIIDDAFQGIAL